MIRVVMPAHLRTLASFQGEVELEVQGTVTVRSVVATMIQSRQFRWIRTVLRMRWSLAVSY